MISVIILAAGESRRMGHQNKLLLPLNGKTLIENIVDNVLDGLPPNSGDELLVVVGHQQAEIIPALQGRRLNIVQNPDYRHGQSSSIRAGVAAANPQSSGFMICLSDLPMILPSEYADLIRHFKTRLALRPDLILRPVYRGRPGNPVLLSRHYRNDILALKGPGGCKGIINRNPAKVLEIEMANDHVLRDVDTEKDYQRLTAAIDKINDQKQ